METIAYRVLRTCHVGPTVALEAVHLEGAIVQLPEHIGDAREELERVVPVEGKLSIGAARAKKAASG